MIKNPEKDYAAPPHSDQLRIGEEPTPGIGEQPLPTAEALGPPAQSPETPPPIEDLMAAHALRSAERGDSWEELSDSNWPEGRIKQALDRQFPDLRTAEDIERAEVAQIRRQAQKAEPKPRRKAPTRYISPRDKGAPPHIVREIRGD